MKKIYGFIIFSSLEHIENKTLAFGACFALVEIDGFFCSFFSYI